MATPDPLVVQVMRRQKALLIARDDTEMRRMGREWLKFERDLQGRIDALAEQVLRLKQQGLTAEPDKVAELSRYKSLLRDVHRELRKYTDWVEGEITSEQRERIWQGTEDANDAIRAAGSGRTIGLQLDRLPVEAAENMVGLASNGSPLMEFLRETWVDSADGLMGALIEAIQHGTNPQTTAREMAQGIAKGPARMLNIARTEQMRVYREANRRAYVRSRVVQAYRRLATPSERTCLGCLALDGKQYRLDQPLGDHPSGRCTLVPVVEGAPPLSWFSGREWLLSQNEGVRARIMGQERFELLEAYPRLARPDMFGIFAVEPRHDVWGRGVQPADVGTIKRKMKRRAIGG